MTTKTDRAAELTLRLIPRPECWPLWPMLPVVRHRPGREPEVGIVLDTRSMGLTGYSATVFTVNLHDLPEGITVKPVQDVPKEVYDSAEEIVAAGWRVD